MCFCLFNEHFPLLFPAWQVCVPSIARVVEPLSLVASVVRYHVVSAAVLPIGQGVIADSIAQCIQLLKKRNWDSVFSIETEGEENVKASVAWLRQQIG